MLTSLELKHRKDALNLQNQSGMENKFQAQVETFNENISFKKFQIP
jgi:hypothetical protein